MKRWWGRLHCLFLPHVWGRWVETDMAAIVPLRFIRQCTCCLKMEHGKKTGYGKVVRTGRPG